MDLENQSSIDYKILKDNENKECSCPSNYKFLENSGQNCYEIPPLKSGFPGTSNGNSTWTPPDNPLQLLRIGVGELPWNLESSYYHLNKDL